MSVLSDHHKTLNTEGFGFCSVPMWCMGMPAGFCDKPAYGERPSCKTYRNSGGYEWRTDGKYSGYVPALACYGHGGPQYRTLMDGNAWCAVEADFINLQESLAGFGAAKEEAITELIREISIKNEKNEQSR